MVFEVIIPNLPGYGFSEATNQPGLSPPKVAQIFKNLMKRLGFETFYVQVSSLVYSQEQYLGKLQHCW